MTACDAIGELVGRGEYLLACDAARQSLDEGSGDERTRYLYVLSMARSGALERATELFSSLGLDRPHPHPDAPLDRDVVALGARLAKDRALASRPVDRALAGESAAAYERLFIAGADPYPGINAATMWLLAGEEGRARELALAVREHPGAGRGDDPMAVYWSAATEAEAALLLGEVDSAAATLVRAAAANPHDLGARASTLRQLEVICEHTGADTAILAPLYNPAILHFCGHRIGAPGEPGRFAPDEEPVVVTEVGRAVESLAPFAGYGSLASGADTIVAEALLDAGAELHLWLPFDRDEFVRASVAPAGAAWVDRFERCVSLATSVEQATVGESMSDPVLFDYCARLAMGDALVRSRFLASPVHQLAVWDGRPTDEVAGTAVDVERWASTGHDTTVIRVEGTTDVQDAPRAEPIRVIRALVFADVAGFGALADSEVVAFDREVLVALGKTIDAYGDRVLLRETWGDGIYLVFTDVTSAADCALDLQAGFASVDLEAVGLSKLRGLRIGAHVGPVLEGWDPVAGRARFTGSHVTRAARIEPRTPEGAVYVTRPFAASVALEAPEAFSCEYVGQVPAAKDHGVVPMYVLTRLG